MLEILNHTTHSGHTVHIATSGIESGNMSTTYAPGGQEKIVYQNRERFYGKIGLEAADVIRIWADGKNEILDLSTTEPALTETNGVRCDGLVTDQFDRGLAMVPADCVPMVVYSHEIPLLGLIHVGRTNAEADFHTKAITHLLENHGTSIENLAVYLGPSIKKESYRYEWMDPTINIHGKWEGYIEHEVRAYYLDLFGLVVDDLVRLGLSPGQIEASPEDTGAADSTYFSHRRSSLRHKPEGRNGIVVVLHPD